MKPLRARISGLLVVVCLLSAYAWSQQKVTIVTFVKAAVAAGDIPAAEKGLSQYRTTAGVTPEYLEALSWIGRGQLVRHDAAAAERNATDVRKQTLGALASRKLDAEPHLPMALGAAIEVEGQALAAQNRRDEAVLFLRSELQKWQGTSIHDRIQKNLNLLTLEGKPAPQLDVSQWIGSRRPQPLTAYRGHPVLLFLWAHWCSDCKNEVGIIQKLISSYGPRGLVVVAPTQHYGYVAGGEDATRPMETKYIGEVFAKYYAGLGSLDIPLSEANFAKFGVSTTPTMVLIDGQGIVRLYNPGNASYEALAAKIETALRGSKASAGKS